MTDLQPRDPTHAEREVFYALGELVTAWNFAENHVRSVIVTIVAGESTIRQHALAEIVTAEMGAVAMAASIRAVAADVVTGPESDHLKHLVALYERVKEYRNFYVHSITGAVTKLRNPSGVFAVITGTSAKSQVAYHNDLLAVAKIRTASAYTD